MTNLKSLSDEVLIDNTQKLAKQEREILSQILHHFREIERRRLFSKLKYSSLFDYATRGLAYSEDQAYRRIQAMRLLKEFPEVESQINDGSLTLTHLGMAQSLFKREEKLQNPLSKSQKAEVLVNLQNTSKREAERIAAAFAKAPIVQTERVRTLSEEDVEIRFTAKDELLKKINKLKGLMAHKNPELKLSELIDQLCDLGLEKWDKSITAPARVTARQQVGKQRPSHTQVRRGIWGRENGQCENCGSEYAPRVRSQNPEGFGWVEYIREFASALPDLQSKSRH